MPQLLLWSEALVGTKSCSLASLASVNSNCLELIIFSSDVLRLVRVKGGVSVNCLFFSRIA